MVVTADGCFCGACKERVGACRAPTHRAGSREDVASGPASTADPGRPRTATGSPAVFGRACAFKFPIARWLTDNIVLADLSVALAAKTILRPAPLPTGGT